MSGIQQTKRAVINQNKIRSSENEFVTADVGSVCDLHFLMKHCFDEANLAQQR